VDSRWHVAQDRPDAAAFRTSIPGVREDVDEHRALNISDGGAAGASEDLHWRSRHRRCVLLACGAVGPRGSIHRACGHDRRAATSSVRHGEPSHLICTLDDGARLDGADVATATGTVTPEASAVIPDGGRPPRFCLIPVEQRLR